MTARPSPRLPQPGELPSIVFRALYSEFELRTLGGLHVAVPKGTPWYAGHSLGEVARQISAAPARPGQWSGRSARLFTGRTHMMILPAPGDAARLAGVLRQYPRWSFFWDKKTGVWRAAEDDPDSALYTASGDLDTVIGYITSHA